MRAIALKSLILSLSFACISLAQNYYSIDLVGSVAKSILRKDEYQAVHITGNSYGHFEALPYQASKRSEDESYKLIIIQKANLVGELRTHLFNGPIDIWVEKFGDSEKIQLAVKELPFQGVGREVQQLLQNSPNLQAIQILFGQNGEYQVLTENEYSKLAGVLVQNVNFVSKRIEAGALGDRKIEAKDLAIDITNIAEELNSRSLTSAELFVFRNIEGQIFLVDTAEKNLCPFGIATIDRLEGRIDEEQARRNCETSRRTRILFR